MNATRDPWAEFADVFAEELAASNKWPPDLINAMADAVALNRADLDALSDEYQREQIESAQSEAATAAIQKEYAK